MSQRTAPLDLWRSAEALLNTLFALFGNPEQIAVQHTLTTARRALMLSWLRAAEALLRRLLLIEAAAVPRETPAPTRMHAQTQRVRRPVAFDPAQPELWRVSFRVLHGFARTRRATTPRRPPRRFHSAWPPAQRCEALLRVYNDPAPYARRLARKLHAAPERAVFMLAHAPPSVGREQIEATAPHARAALKAFGIKARIDTG